jgi:hypothetical protein
MPKQLADQLVLLIRSLTKAEKRHFKLYVRRNAGGSDALFLKLFAEIERQKGYDDKEILSRVPMIKKSQLHNLRSKLYKEILVSLRHLQRAQKIEITIREMLDFAQVLYSKGLYRQSLNMLEKAKSKALEVHLTALALEITAFEKHIESQHITRSIDTKSEELTKSSNALALQVTSETAFSNLSLQLYGLYLKMGHARSKKEESEVKSFFLKHLPEHNENTLSFYEKLYLYQSFVWLYQISQEFAKQYRYARKWVDLFDENPQVIQYNIPLYLKGLHNLLNSQYLTLQYDRFVDSLAELSRFNSDHKYQLNENDEGLQVIFTYMHRLNLHFLEGSFSEGVSWVDELDDILKSGKYNWDTHRNMVFYYKLACIHFSAGDNHRAIEYLNLIINQASQKLREDIQCFARILNLIAHYELGNDILVSYQLKSVYRFFLKMEALNATHVEIFAFLRRTPKMTPELVRDEFIGLKERLLIVQNKRFEKRSGLYLDIISWLESKIENRPVQDVIADKFKRLRALGEI